ncbi:hypothetical protein SS50377_20214 [Spironucleus salmonicida]|uniref:Uncharacterized protein n=1 Tax=Spironucleus salmonicida TaxID=348837 RepID=V6LKW3_9EUKA|nr:hypothetical protein SS50377_20214 [Spironucleus salmonicida]|eukprot:EST45270.1 hypothetical protein SS50377_14846 [Spironucleus salmonicida]
MSLDIPSIINLPFSISQSSPSTQILNALPHSLSILLRHYKLSQIRISALIKCLNRSEYLLAESNNTLFVSRDGSFWSPLPVLDLKDLETLEKEGFGIFSRQAFLGDPGVVLAGELTEMHRVSQFAVFLQNYALYPKNSRSYAERWQGMNGQEAGDIQNYEFQASDADKQQGQGSYFDFYFNKHQDKSFYRLKQDAFNKRTILEFRLLPQFKCYYYWNQRVYGWQYVDTHYSHNNALLSHHKCIFNQELNVDLTIKQKTTLEEIQNQISEEVLEDNKVLAERKVKSDELQAKKNEIKKKIKEYKADKIRKEKEKAEKEEAERKAAEEKQEGEEGEAETE